MSLALLNRTSHGHPRSLVEKHPQSNKKHKDPRIGGKNVESLKFQTSGQCLYLMHFYHQQRFDVTSPLLSSPLLSACHLLNTATAAALSYPKWVLRLFLIKASPTCISSSCSVYNLSDSGPANSITESSYTKTCSEEHQGIFFSLPLFQLKHLPTCLFYLVQLSSLLCLLSISAPAVYSGVAAA